MTMSATEEVTAEAKALGSAANVFNQVHKLSGLSSQARSLLQTGEAAAVAAQKQAGKWLMPPSPVITPTSPGAPVGSPSGYAPTPDIYVGALLLEEPFAGTELNSALWTPSVTWQENNVRTDPANVIVNDGLTLRLSSPSDGGLITAQGKFSFLYGYTEWDVNIPSLAPDGGLPNWFAVWLDSLNASDGTWHEWDIFEALGLSQGSGGRATSTLHYPSSGSEQATMLVDGIEAGDLLGSHTFGLNWYATGADVYIGTEKVGTITKGANTANVPMWPMANIGCGTWGGQTVAPYEIGIGYCRIWAAA
jgi:hypothetical protein